MEEELIMETPEVEVVSGKEYSYEETPQGIWHMNFKILDEGGSAIGQTSNPPGGCGLYNFYGWSNYSHRVDWKDIFQYMRSILLTKEERGDSYDSFDCGAYQIQIGKDFYNSNFCKALDELKVEYIEYSNPRHSGDYTQRSYFLKK